MVFNSFIFIFFFLPIIVCVFYYLTQKFSRFAPAWLVLTSFIFYASWDYRYLPILIGSITVNFVFLKQITHCNKLYRKPVLLSAIAFNLALLCFFKYVNFFIVSINDLTNSSYSVISILLPVGISFFTFTQIAILVDAYYDKIKDIDILQYILFTSYFPYIVAGPILDPKQIIPQFSKIAKYQFNAGDLVVGLSLFVFGLAKKLIIADNLATSFSPLFYHPNPHFLQAWLGMIAYTFQLYFDFSGYSDMAIGVSRILGCRLPLNFNSPYKATNVSDFWQRWHISLSAFLRNYLYIPLGGNRYGQIARFRNLIITMLLGGLWHGANWTFVIWGGLHGIFLCIQHGYHYVQRDRPRLNSAVFRHLSHTLTFVCVVIAWCFFRAPSVAAAMDVLAGMVGFHGVTMVTEIDLSGYAVFSASALIVFFLPNTNQLFLGSDSFYEKKLDSLSFYSLHWAPTLQWGIITGFIFALCVLSIERTNDFIYAQF